MRQRLGVTILLSNFGIWKKFLTINAYYNKPQELTTQALLTSASQKRSRN